MTERRPHLRAVPQTSSDAAGVSDTARTVDTSPRRQVNEVGVPTDASTWEDLVPRLLLLAMSRLSRMTWRGQLGSAPPGAADAEDFVNDAIAKTLSGVRVWREANCMLFQHLAGIVVSDISHAATAAENRLTLADDGRQRGGWPPDRADDRSGQEGEALWRSEQQRLLGYLAAIDPMLGRMAELMLIEDIDGSVELAGRLDVTVSDVANLRKRMKRATRAFILADEEGGP